MAEDGSVKELRIGLVLYGGVSLAVYMNGIVTEVWRAVQASKAGKDPGPLSPTAGIYHAFLQDLEQTEGLAALRIVVDAIAGSSAGGLNGAVLAKALAEGGDASVLSNVWLETADIGKVKAPARKPMPWALRQMANVISIIGPLTGLRQMTESIPSIGWPWARDQAFGLTISKNGRETPLDGDYFARMIAKTFDDMGEEAAAVLLPTRASLDLFLTGTDFCGWPRHLPVSPQFHPEPLYERSHATWSHFRRAPGGQGLNDNFGLTYAARRTASFPGAFAPIVVSDVAKAYRDAGIPLPPDSEQELYRHHLAEHYLAGFSAETAYMVDGGVLDNRPFTQVTKVIERKPADHQVYRALLFVEPSPDTTALEPPPDKMPKPLSVMTGLFGLFRHEPIVGDLRTLAERNRTVRRILDALAAAYPAMLASAKAAGTAQSLAWPPQAQDLKAWRSLANSAALRASPSATEAYRLLKLRRSGRLLGDLLCTALDYPTPSRHAFVVRGVLERYLLQRGVLPPLKEDFADQPLAGTQVAADAEDEEWRRFLSAFDLRFRRQRLSWLAQAANRLYGDSEVTRAELDGFKRALSDLQFAYDGSLGDMAGLRAQLYQVFGDDESGADIQRQIDANAFDLDGLLTTYKPALDQLYDALLARFQALEDKQRTGLEAALATLTGKAFEQVTEAYVTFPFVDIVAYPMMDLAGIEELSNLRTLRVSPLDNRSLPHKTLLSDAYGAFGGFLDRKARAHDLLWGHLDGAERLVDLLLAAAAGDQPLSPAAEALRDRTKKALFQAIVAEADTQNIEDKVAEVEAAVAKL
ncbi:MAG: patatin-like protein [Pseudomonadota bacterium]